MYTIWNAVGILLSTAAVAAGFAGEIGACAGFAVAALAVAAYPAWWLGKACKSA
jgi:hypothetical protein